MKKLVFTGLLLIFVLASSFAQEHSNNEPYFFTPGDKEWADGPPTLPKGPKFFLIEGDIQEDDPRKK